jgi:predicted transcriptional regulator
MELSDIKKLRLKAGMSQTALAQKAGISQAHIAKIESGKVDPRFSTMERIFRCLKEEQKDHCSKYMTPHIHGVQATDNAAEAGRMMREKEISQVAVFKGESIIGLITEEDLLRFKGNLKGCRAEDVMGEAPPTVSKLTSSDTVRDLLLEFPAVIVVDRDKMVGIITKSDLIKRA